MLAEVATLEVESLGRKVDEGDHGLAQSYLGTLTVNGFAYRFRCSVFVGRSGERSLSEVAAFALVAEKGKALLARRLVLN
jgi:hypothetical protein